MIFLSIIIDKYTCLFFIFITLLQLKSLINLLIIINYYNIF